MKAVIEEWLEEIELGYQYRETFGNSNDWPTYRNYGRGIFPGFNGSSSGILPYNVTYALKRGLIPNVYFKNPYINITPTDMPGADVQARILESVDNQLAIDLDLESTIKMMIQDCYYCGRGIAKIGYDFQVSLNERISDLLSMPLSHLGKNRKERVEYDQNIKAGYPWTVRVQPDFFIVPYGTQRITDCPWVDHITYRRLSDVKNTSYFKNTKDLQGTHVMYLNKNSNKFFDGLLKGEDIVELHEVRNFKKRELCVFIPGYDQWIRPPQSDPLQKYGVPYVDFTFDEDSEYYWSPSDVQIFEPQQLEINEARTQAMKHRRLALIKFLVEKDGMEPTEVDKMLSEDVGPAVFTKGKPQDLVYLLQPHIPPDLVQWTDVIRTDIQEMMGFGKQQLGTAPAGRRSATEMRDVQYNSDVRIDERRQQVARALTVIMRKCNNIIYDKWDEERLVPVIGFDGAKYWVNYKMTGMQFNYTMRVDVESMTPRTKANKRREIVELITALGNNPRANIDYLMKLLLREYDWIDAMKVFPEAPETLSGPMQAQQFMQQQQALLQDPATMKKRTAANAQMMGRTMG